MVYRLTMPGTGPEQWMKLMIDDNIDIDQFKIDIKINRQSIVKVFGMKDCH